MAHKKAVGGTRLGRDSKSKRLGVKIYGGEIIKTGQIIIRQRGTKFTPGENVGIGKDHTIFAMINGIVDFKKKKLKSFSGRLDPRVLVNVRPIK